MIFLCGENDTKKKLTDIFLGERREQTIQSKKVIFLRRKKTIKLFLN